MSEVFRELQDKYLTWDLDGEDCSFNDDYLKENERELHTEFTELFETGLYLSNHTEMIERITAWLNRESVAYQIAESNLSGYEIKLKK